MHQRHVAGDVGEIQRFFHGGVAAADDRDLLGFVKKAVAGRAARYAFAHECLLRGNAQIFGGSTGGDNQRVASVRAGVADERHGFFSELGGVDMIENNFGVEAFRVRLKARHQIRALHAVCIGGPVIHVSGGHQLAALAYAGNQDWLQIRARGVNGGAITGGAGTEDE